MDNQNLHLWRLLEEIGDGQGVSQRRLAHRAGIALGLTNVLLRQLVARGFVRVVPPPGTGGVRYLITNDGAVERARMSRGVLEHAIESYREARERVSAQLLALSQSWPVDVPDKSIAFYGGGALAEVAYLSLQTTDLRLIALYDDDRMGDFFGVPVKPIRDLASLDRPCRVVVTSFERDERLRSTLAESGVPLHEVIWL